MALNGSESKLILIKRKWMGTAGGVVGGEAPQQVTECRRVYASQGFVRLISPQPPAERLCLISISNGSGGNLFLNGTLIVVMVCSAAPLPPLQPFHSPPSHCILMTRSVRLPVCLLPFPPLSGPALMRAAQT